MKTIISRSILLIASLAFGSLLHADPVCIGHPGYKGQTLDTDGVKAVLLGKRVTIGDTRAVIVIAKTGEAQEAFLQARVGMTTSQFQTHWRRLFMTGGGSAPKIVETDVEACKIVAETPGAVAIADQAKAEGLTILTQ